MKLFPNILFIVASHAGDMKFSSPRRPKLNKLKLHMGPISLHEDINEDSSLLNLGAGNNSQRSRKDYKEDTMMLLDTMPWWSPHVVPQRGRLLEFGDAAPLNGSPVLFASPSLGYLYSLTLSSVSLRLFTRDIWMDVFFI